jgi:hypothetical protein
VHGRLRFRKDRYSLIAYAGDQAATLTKDCMQVSHLPVSDEGSVGGVISYMADATQETTGHRWLGAGGGAPLQNSR